ncbi:MAG: DUF2304 domain-containing protein, partial [Desulfohalobiaceae bacterium]
QDRRDPDVHAPASARQITHFYHMVACVHVHAALLNHMRGQTQEYYTMKMIADFNYLTAGLGLGIWLAIIWMIRRDVLHVRYSFWWFIVGTGVAVTGVFPGVIDWLGRSFNVSYPPVLGLVIGFCLIFIKVLINDLERSRQIIQIRVLTQKLAILEQRVEEEQSSKQEKKLEA